MLLLTNCRLMDTNLLLEATNLPIMPLPNYLQMIPRLCIQNVAILKDNLPKICLDFLDCKSPGYQHSVIINDQTHYFCVCDNSFFKWPLRNLLITELITSGLSQLHRSIISIYKCILLNLKMGHSRSFVSLFSFFSSQF